MKHPRREKISYKEEVKTGSKQEISQALFK